ncbi:hypothetical protein [Streptomyces sp. NPDC088261]|uniref:hypothetical protein n=1 Tax=Streptomyces sp. NPDC088261 TaxID=3365851 RepID=UPI00381D5F1A
MQIAAVRRDQSRNTMTLMPSLMSDKVSETYGIKAGAELIRANGGRQRLKTVTSSFRALEGGRVTFTVLNETHHCTSNNGDRVVRDDRRQRAEEVLVVSGDHVTRTTRSRFIRQLCRCQEQFESFCRRSTVTRYLAQNVGDSEAESALRTATLGERRFAHRG